MFHQLHGDAVANGLLPSISYSVADVRGLPTPVAIGVVLTTLESIRADVAPAEVRGPLTIRLDAPSANRRHTSDVLQQCRQAIARYCRFGGLRGPRCYESSSQAARLPLDEATDELLIGRELIISERSLRNWLHATQGSRGRMARGRRRRRGPSEQRQRISAQPTSYWERGGSTLGPADSSSGGVAPPTSNDEQEGET